MFDTNFIWSCHAQLCVRR